MESKADSKTVVTAATTGTQSTKPLSIVASQYHDYLGLKDTKSKSIALSIDPNLSHVTEFSTLKRLMLFVLDRSGSMEDVMDSTMKPLIMALYDNCPGFGKTIFWKILVFSGECKEIFTNFDQKKDISPEQFKKIMDDELVAQGGTNTEDAFKMAFKTCAEHKDLPIMIIHVTDGDPSVGLRNTTTLAKNIKSEMAKYPNVSLVNIGMGEHYKEEFMTDLGQLTHIQNPDQVIDIGSNFFYTVSNLFVFNLSIETKTESETTTKTIGMLNHENKYIHIHNQENDSKVVFTIKYTDMKLEHHSVSIEIDPSTTTTYQSPTITVVKEYMLGILNKHINLFKNSHKKADSIHGLKGVSDLLDYSIFAKYDKLAKTTEEKKVVQEAHTQIKETVKIIKQLCDQYDLVLRGVSSDTGAIRDISALYSNTTQQVTLARGSSNSNNMYRDDVMRSASAYGYVSSAQRAASQPQNIHTPQRGAGAGISAPMGYVPLQRSAAMGHFPVPDHSTYTSLLQSAAMAASSTPTPSLSTNTQTQMSTIDEVDPSASSTQTPTNDS